MKTILIVDDEPTQRRLLYHTLKSSYRIVEAGDFRETMERLEEEEVDLVLADLHLPPDLDTAEEGIRLHSRIRERDPLLPVVITTGDKDRSLALDMVRRGVADFLLKPIDPVVLQIVIARALERARLEQELESLRQEMQERYSFGRMFGRSAAQRAVFSRLRKLARLRTSVLLLGESGTGKSIAARTLHQQGDRADGPFVVVDGAAIPETLIESELFGNVRGAFSGADRDREGRITIADGGTLFLDEIGNLSLEAQAKLLIFLDRHVVTPVGSTKEIPVDVRLIAATNRDLENRVRDGRFREDLLYRIQVVTVELPPLRRRPEDILPLADQILAEVCRSMRRPRVTITPEAAALLEGYPWPGNIRQLRHVLESSLVQLDGDRLDADRLLLPSIPERFDRTQSGVGGGIDDPALPFKQRMAAIEKGILKRALEDTGGNKAAAGRLLGLDENQIRYLCRKHGLMD
jgi:DNA-binding NtrC family response regulator